MDYSSRAHFNNYDPSSFGWSRTPDLVPFQSHGANFGQVARAAVPVFTALLDELVPHIPGGIAGKPLDDWGYAATDDLPDGSWSFHHYGIAIDVNWSVNHMGNNIPDPTGPGAIPRSWATSIAAKYGCEWGGNWSSGFHDLMHFEIHLSPADARTVVGAAPTDLLEVLMSLDRTSADYKALLADVQHAVNNPAWVSARDGKPHSPDTVIRAAVGDHVDGAVKLLADMAPRVATLAKTVAGLAIPAAVDVTAITNAVVAKVKALSWKASA